MEFIKFINSGSNKGFHAAMLSACLSKYGENQNKSPGKYISQRINNPKSSVHKLI